MRGTGRPARFSLLLVPVIVVTLTYAEHEETPSRIDWGPYGVSRVFSVARVGEDDADGVDLRGLNLGYGVRDQSGECNCGLGAWLAVQSGHGQRVIGLGGEYIRLLLGTQRVPFAGRASLGVEDRRRDPQSGLVGVVGLGFELGYWPWKSTHFAITFDRDFGFPAYTRNVVGVFFRLARPYAHSGPVAVPPEKSIR